MTPTALWSVDRSIVNSAVISKTLRNRTIPLQIYNETINCEGYIANLSINSRKGGVFVLRLQNDFGDTRQEFSVAAFQAKGSKTHIIQTQNDGLKLVFNIQKSISIEESRSLQT